MASIIVAASRATTARASSSVLAQQRLLLAHPLTAVRFLSSVDNEDFDVEDDDLPNKQDFVKVRLEPGEWDTNHTDPIHRPPWKNKAKIISAEDFANRPRAGFRDEFASPYDAMLVLSWLDRPTQEKIYSSYLSLMQTMQDKEKVTSHEYVMRVIAQKYNITASRVAGVVQLLHNEDQIRKQHPEQKIYYDTQDYVDARIAEHIANCYDAFRQKPPEAPFIEDPMGVTGMGDIDRRVSGQEEAGDELDYDELVEKALIREQRDARLAIDNYEYITDVDESTISIQTTADCQKLLKKQQEQLKEDIAARPDNMRPLPENGSGEVRKRWKYVAEIINTRDQKNHRRGRRGNKLMKNAIVEEDGDLRVASVAEVKTTSWKPERNTQEFTYHGVKQAWLERTLEGKIGGWGRVERPVETKKEESEASPVVDEVQVTEGDDAEEGEESSSSEEEEETELNMEEEYNEEEEDDPKKKKK